MPFRQGDASNRRVTRSRAAAGTKRHKTTAASILEAASAAAEPAKTAGAPPARRRSARLSGEHEKQGKEQQVRLQVAAGAPQAAALANKKQKQAAVGPRPGQSRSARVDCLASDDSHLRVEEDGNEKPAAKKKSTKAQTQRGRPRKRKSEEATAVAEKTARRSSSTCASSRSTTNSDGQSGTRSRSSARTATRWKLGRAEEAKEDEPAAFAAVPPPQHDPGNHNLVLPHLDPGKYTRGLSVYDVPNRGNVLESPEYVCDIFQRLYHAEVCPVSARVSVQTFKANHSL